MNKIRLLPDSDHRARILAHCESILRNFGNVEIDNRRLSVGNRLQEALEENIDLILLIGDEVDLGLYSVIYKGHRYSHKMEDILQLIVEA
ncbi:MAG: hypothetical protein ACXAE3_02005 [Candidatus Kariarchaeaceae archaeon]|jgi:hypothetical protein